MLAAPKAKSDQDEARILTPSVAAALLFQGAAREECAVGAEPLHPTRRIAIQNASLHHTCLCCEHCGKALSLLNYATFCGAFYCKAHYKLLAVVKESSQVPPVAPEPKNSSNQMGRILLQEKIRPRLSGSHPQVSPKTHKQARQLSSEETSQDQLGRASWPPFKEAVENNPDGEHNRSKLNEALRNRLLSLQRQGRADGKPCRAQEDKWTAETLQPEKKQDQMGQLTFPKEGKHVSHWMKTVDANGDLGVLERRLSLMDKSISGALRTKKGPSISEKDTIFQHNSVKGKRPGPVVSPLRSIPRKPSPVASGPPHSGAFRHEKVTHLANTGVPVSDPSHLARVPFAGKKLSTSFSNKGASDERSTWRNLRTTLPLPRARVRLPALTPPDNTPRRKLPGTSKTHKLITLALKETNPLSRVSPEQTHAPNTPKTKPEVVVSLPGQKEEESSKTKPGGTTSVEHPDSVVACLTMKQGSEQLWADRNDLPHLWRPSENQLYPESPSEEMEVKKKEEMQEGSISGRSGALDCISDQASQETNPVGAEMGGRLSASSSQAAEPEHMDLPPRNNPRDAILTCNATVSVREAPEAGVSQVKTACAIEDLPRSANENNIQSQLQDYPSGTIILQASSLQVKDPEASNSSEISFWNECQLLENRNGRTKPGRDCGLIVQEICHKNLVDSSATKQPFKNEKNPLAHFFAEGSIPKQQPTSRTKKAHKTPSALMTLFGYSLDKGKNWKESLGTPLPKASEEARNKDHVEAACSSKPGTSKKEKASEVVPQTRSLDASLQDPEQNYGSCVCNEQGNRSASLDGAETFGTNMRSSNLGPDISGSTEALFGRDKPEVPEQTILKMEAILRSHGKPSSLDDSHNPLPATKQMLQCPVNNFLEPSSEMSSASGGDLNEQRLLKLPVLANLDGQQVTPKAPNISSSSPSRDDESPLLDRGHQVPDMVLFSVGVERSANMWDRDPWSTPSSDTGSTQRKDELCSGLNSSETIMQINNLHQFSESGVPTMIKGANLDNKDPPGSGNSEKDQCDDPVSWPQSSADAASGLDLHVKQATIVTYPTGGKDASPSLASCHHIPELLRDTIRSTAEEKFCVRDRKRKTICLTSAGNQALDQGDFSSEPERPFKGLP